MKGKYDTQQSHIEDLQLQQTISDANEWWILHVKLSKSQLSETERKRMAQIYNQNALVRECVERVPEPCWASFLASRCSRDEWKGELVQQEFSLGRGQFWYHSIGGDFQRTGSDMCSEIAKVREILHRDECLQW